MTSFVGRMIGAATLDARVFEEIEADQTATGQALAVVALASLAAAVGGARLGVMGAVWTLLAALVGWFVAAGLIYLVGTKLLPAPTTRADLGQVLRVVGFAAAPGMLRVLGLLPCLGFLVAILATLWSLAATVVGVRHALDHEGYGRTIVVCLIGWVAYLVIGSVVATIFAGARILGGTW